MLINAARSTFYSMGTLVSCIASGEGSEKAVEEAEAEISKIEQKLSRFRNDSEIGAINKSAGSSCVEVSAETFALLENALELCGFSMGLFDITIGPLMDLWGDFDKDCNEPAPGEIDEALALVDYKDVVLDYDRKEVYLKRQGQKIDLGAIGKGYAADRAIQKMKELGITSAYVNIGGNVATLGGKPDSSAWRIGILHPRQLNTIIGSLSVTGKSVVTSGDYFRCRRNKNDKALHHILDTRNGYPSRSGIISATVVSDCSLTADALSTILFTAGKDEAQRILSEFDGCDAVLVDENLEIFMSAGIAGAFQAADNIKPFVLN